MLYGIRAMEAGSKTYSTEPLPRHGYQPFPHVLNRLRVVMEFPQLEVLAFYHQSNISLWDTILY